LLFLGCGKKDTPQAKAEDLLTKVYEVYQLYIKNHQSPPTKLADFKTYEGSHPAAVDALKQGKYDVVYGVSGKDGATVLAYEKDAGSKGGLVLMADGTVKQMSAEQFNAAKKGGG
jgi:hypothetical protein